MGVHCGGSVVCNGDDENAQSSSALYKSVGRSFIESTEVEGTEYTRIPIDTHGTAILDIDRDGLLDMYIATGGGMGLDSGPAKHAVIMWGEKVNSTMYGIKQTFRGGRKTAEESGLDNADSRGRFTYLADFNRDGLLDMVFSNEARVDSGNSVGYAVFNAGGRKFTKHYELSEYANTMVLTDADHDGHADEFVVQRSKCLPVDDLESGVKGAKPSAERTKFCEARPVGTTAIYKYDVSRDEMVCISPEFTAEDDTVDEEGTAKAAVAQSMQTADFDGDLLADLAVLYEEEVHLFLSSKRKHGELPIGKPDEKLHWELWWGPNRCLGRALRIADFNLDGEQELLVMCAQLGRHLLWQKDSFDKWVARHGDLGALEDKTSARVQEPLLVNTCSQGKPPAYIKAYCAALEKHQDLPVASTYGMAVVDWDNDGYTDVTLTHDVGSLMMLRNNWGDQERAKGRRFLALRLVGHFSNEYGIGATVFLQARDVGWKRQNVTQLREVTSASHETDWWGSRDDRLIFGLGVYGVPEKVTVKWPGKGRQTQIVDDEAFLWKHMNTMTHLLRIYEPQFY